MKKVINMMLILLLGIFIGAGIGVAVGIQIATGVPEVTNTPTEAPTPIATAIPASTVTPTLTVVPTETGIPTPTVAPTATNTPTPSPTEKPSDSEAAEKTDGFYGALHVEGTHLAAEDGTLVQLRGVSTHGLGWFPEYVNESMIAQVRQEWGCNVFRLAMYTAEYNGYCTSDSKQKENLKRIVDMGVAAAVEQDMYVIIDWHILSDNNPNTYKAEAKKFFAEMAKTYADVPNVIYEICNEPNGGTGWSAIKEYALEIIPVIREHAPEAVIIVGTPTWSQDVDIAAKNPITEYDNIMYALHFYAATHTDGLRNKCKAAVSMGLPLFVTEYGICDASGSGAIDEFQANQWISLLDSYGISHAMWNLSNKSETSAMIKSSCSKTSNLAADDLSATGNWFVKMMKNAGLGSEDWVMPEPEENTGNGSSTGNSDAANAGQTMENIPTVEDIFEAQDNITLTASNSWVSETGYGIQLNVTIKNTGSSEETDWMRELKVKDGMAVSVAQCWCAKVKPEGSSIIIQPEEYNKTVPAGGEVSGIGIILEVKPQ